MKLAALVFDAYGTLFDVHSVVARCERLWPGQGRALSERWRAKQLEYTWLRSLMGRYQDFERISAESLRHACDVLGIQCGEDQVAELLAEYRRLAPFPEVAAALPQLAGMKRLILSNGTPAMLARVVRHAGLEGQFDAVLSVDAVWAYKPDPRVYQLAVDAIGIEVGRIGFVSANGWDAAGAKAFGFQVFWINRAGAAWERLDAAPDHVLASLAELPARSTVAE